MLLLKYISTIWFASSASALFNSFTGRQKIIQPSESTMGHYPCWLFSCPTMEGFIQKQVILRLPDEIVFYWPDLSRSDVKPTWVYCICLFIITIKCPSKGFSNFYIDLNLGVKPKLSLKCEIEYQDAYEYVHFSEGRYVLVHNITSTNDW